MSKLKIFLLLAVSVLGAFVLLVVSLNVWSSYREKAEATATETKRPVLREVSFLLPADGAIRPRWILSPQDTTKVIESGWYGALFAVDAQGAPLFGRNDKALVSPRARWQVTVSYPFRSLACLDTGALILGTQSAWGFIADGLNSTDQENPLPTAVFQPVANYPVDSARVFAGTAGSLYFAGLNRGLGEYQVYVVKPEELRASGDRPTGIRGVTQVFAGKAPISAVAGDGETTYVGTGKTVLKITRNGEKVEPLYTDPENDIEGLAYSPEAGLCFNTASMTGYLGSGGAIPVLVTDTPISIAIRRNVLYVCFRSSLGVLALENIGELRKYSGIAAQPSVKSAPQLTVKKIHLLDTDPSDVSKTEVSTFDRNQNGYIECAIDMKCSVSPKHYRPHTITVEWRHESGVLLDSESFLAGVPPDSGGPTCTFIAGRGVRERYYPGRYTLTVLIDGLKAADTSFTVTGKATLAEAVQQGDEATARQLLDQGADANAKIDENRPVISEAVRTGSAGLVELLLKHGANPNLTGQTGETALFTSISWLSAPETETKIELLLSHGANPNLTDKEGRSMLSLAALVCPNPRIAALLLDHGGQVDVRESTTGYTPLMELVSWSTPEANGLAFAELFLQHKAALNARDKNGRTPLSILVQSSADPDFLSLFLKYGASVRVKAVDARSSTEEPSSVLHSALLTCAEYATAQDWPRAMKAREGVSVLLKNGATLLPSEEEVILKDEVRGWLDREFMLTLLKRTESLFYQAGALEDGRIDPLLVEILLGRAREKASGATSSADFAKAMDPCYEARVFAVRNYAPVAKMLAVKKGAQPLGVRTTALLGKTYVIDVLPDSLAADAGIECGDIIEEIGGDPVNGSQELNAMVAKLPDGQSHEVVLRRDSDQAWSELHYLCGALERLVDQPAMAEADLANFLRSAPQDARGEKVRDWLRQLRSERAGSPSA